MAFLRITPTIFIDEAELHENFVLASGPGGQNVNKVATAVQLRFDVAHSRSLPNTVRARLMALAGRRLTREGVLVLNGRRFRSQERNRADVRERLADLICQAATVVPKRRATKPSKAVKKRRLEQKSARGILKRSRGKPPVE
jgi:ribosome-associated protein